MRCRCNRVEAVCANPKSDYMSPVVASEVLWSANEILKKVIHMESASAQVDSGALASSSVWLDCACQGSPKNELGAVRRFSFLRLHR
jgi:hypothetical protein